MVVNTSEKKEASTTEKTAAAGRRFLGLKLMALALPLLIFLFLLWANTDSACQTNLKFIAFDYILGVKDLTIVDFMLLNMTIGAAVGAALAFLFAWKVRGWLAARRSAK